MSLASSSATPSRFENLVFLAKTKILQLIRGWQNSWNPAIKRWSPPANTPQELPLRAISSSNLWMHTTSAEWILQAGKIHNLRQAIAQINGIEIPAGGIFSFWAQVGHPSSLRGFAEGRELREGCIIPSVGGGLCQLSNALYDAALQAGLEIIERHAHTQVIPGSLAEIDRDATVFWNYVDLRFRVATPLCITVMMDDQILTVQLHTHQTAPVTTAPEVLRPVAHLNNCLSCGVTSCFRQQQSSVPQGRTAYLLDDYWPEFDRYLQTHRTDQDYLLLPVAGKRIKKANYAWNTNGFSRVDQYRSILALRAAQSILLRIARQGAKFQQLLRSQSRYLARIYGRSLTLDTTHLVVMQSLLPHLWQAGYLQGRSFDVLMTALPMQMLQARLDVAATQHPQSPTLNNFRVSPSVSAEEIAALQQAKHIITPHAELATLWPEKTELLNWVLPVDHLRCKRSYRSPQRPRESLLSTTTIKAQPVVVLPSSSLGRKGIYELKAALTDLNIHLIIAGAELEEPGFWQDCDMEYLPYAQALPQATVVVLPAWVEHQPRRLLQAIAQGIPTIASTACGLHHIPEVITVPAGDIIALRTALKSAIDPQYQLVSHCGETV
jgi:VanW like protein